MSSPKVPLPGDPAGDPSKHTSGPAGERLPADAFPTDAVPSGTVLPGALPPGALPADAVPPGALPANAIPPGALPPELAGKPPMAGSGKPRIRIDRKSTRLNSSHVSISYAVFCLKKKKKKNTPQT